MVLNGMQWDQEQKFMHGGLLGQTAAASSQCVQAADDMERVQWMYYDRANDAYTVGVESLAAISEPSMSVRVQCSKRSNLPCLFAVDR